MALDLRALSLQKLNDPRVRRILRWVLYPIFYAFVLFIFMFWTFPYQRLKDRVIAEFNTQQPAGPGVRLEIEEMSSYWLSGLEADNVKLISPPGAPGLDGKTPPEKVVTIDHAHATVSLLRLIFGTTKVGFGADAFGGELSGQSTTSSDGQSFSVELDEVGLGQLPMLGDIVELPLGGTLSGTIDLELPEAKLAKAEGKIELNASEVSVGDGKTKIKGAIALPRADAGELEIVAEVSEGKLKFESFSLTGKDLELVADGQIRLRDPFNTSMLEMSLRFRFSDSYRGKNDTTKTLLGAPGSTVPPMLEMVEPKAKRAKRADGFYGWRLSGTLQRPTFSPAPSGADSGAARGSTRKATTRP